MKEFTTHTYIIGVVTNGEFNSFRTRGITRPVSVLAIRSDARVKYTKMGKKKMMAMLTPKCKYIYITPIYIVVYLTGFI